MFSYFIFDKEHINMYNYVIFSVRGIILDRIPVFLKDFLNYMETIRGISKLTVREYYYDLRLFLKYLNIHKGLSENEDIENISIKDIDIDLVKSVTLSDLYSYISYSSRERDNIAASRARKVASLKSFFNYLYRKARVLDYNPASELESPKINKRLPKYLNLDESKKLLNAVEGKNRERDYAIIVLFLNCGLRLSELVGININDIKNYTLRVIGKGDKERIIYLNNACLAALNRYLKVRYISKKSIDKNALFISERKQRMSAKTVQYLVKKYIKAAGLDTERYSTHKLRHTAATLMYKHGNVDINTLQHILGHESISTTEIYTHVENSQLKKAIDSNPLSRFNMQDK